MQSGRLLPAGKVLILRFALIGHISSELGNRQGHHIKSMSPAVSHQAPASRVAGGPLLQLLQGR